MVKQDENKQKQVSKMINSTGTCWIWDVCRPSKLKHPVSTWIIRLWNFGAACAEYRFRSHRCRRGTWSPTCGRDSPRRAYTVGRVENWDRTLAVWQWAEKNREHKWGQEGSAKKAGGKTNESGWKEASRGSGGVSKSVVTRKAAINYYKVTQRPQLCYLCSLNATEEDRSRRLYRKGIVSQERESFPFFAEDAAGALVL